MSILRRRMTYWLISMGVCGLFLLVSEWMR